MKNKVILKIALILLMVALMVTMSCEFTTVQARVVAAPADGGGGGGSGGAAGGSSNSNFSVSEFEDKSNASIDTPVSDVAGAILNVIRVIGLGVAIIMIAMVAIKYMMAAPGERADLKKSSIQYVIGAIVVFGATNILQIVINFALEAFPG